MNWISENKFLAGFIAFMIVGVGALGFLLFESLSDYSVAKADYNTKFGQLDGLQKHVPYPNQKNLENYEKQHDELSGVIDTLEQSLSKIQIPLDPNITPQIFQKNLQAAIAGASDKASANSTGKIDIPDKFAFGFDKYVNTLSIASAAPALDRELKAIQFIIDDLLDGGGIQRISSITRAPLAEEKEPSDKPEKPGAKPTPVPLVVKNLVEITFTGSQDKVRKVLNDLVETKKQFYIVRLVEISTTGGIDKTVPKADAFKDRLLASGAPRFVLGEETLDVTLSVEIANFNPPPPPK